MFRKHDEISSKQGRVMN